MVASHDVEVRLPPLTAAAPTARPPLLLLLHAHRCCSLHDHVTRAEEEQQRDAVRMPTACPILPFAALTMCLTPVSLKSFYSSHLKALLILRACLQIDEAKLACWSRNRLAAFFEAGEAAGVVTVGAAGHSCIARHQFQ